MSPSPITNTYEFHISPTTLPPVEAGSNASLLVRMTQELLSGISRNIGESYSDQKITEKVAQKITDYLLSNQCGTLISDMDMCALSPFGPSGGEHAPEESMSLQDWAGTNTTTVGMNAIATGSQITVTHQQALHILSLVK